MKFLAFVLATNSHHKHVYPVVSPVTLLPDKHPWARAYFPRFRMTLKKTAKLLWGNSTPHPKANVIIIKNKPT